LIESIGQIFYVDRGAPVFNAFTRGKHLNSGPQNLVPTN